MMTCAGGEDTEEKPGWSTSDTDDPHDQLVPGSREA
jgi:hypothetical protein